MQEPFVPLSAELAGYFDALQHSGDLPPAPYASRRRGEAGSEAQGTHVVFALGEGSGGLTARFRAYGCPYTLAVCEWLCCRLEALAVHRVGPGTPFGGPLAWAKTLGVPDGRLGRLLVVEDALRRAVESAAR